MPQISYPVSDCVYDFIQMVNDKKFRVSFYSGFLSTKKIQVLSCSWLTSGLLLADFWVVLASEFSYCLGDRRDKALPGPPKEGIRQVCHYLNQGVTAVEEVKTKARLAEVEVFFRERTQRCVRRGDGEGNVRRVGATTDGGAAKSRGRWAA